MITDANRLPASTGLDVDAGGICVLLHDQQLLKFCGRPGCSFFGSSAFLKIADPLLAEMRPPRMCALRSGAVFSQSSQITRVHATMDLHFGLQPNPCAASSSAWKRRRESIPLLPSHRPLFRQDPLFASRALRWLAGFQSANVH